MQPSFRNQLTAVFGYGTEYGKSHHEKSKAEIQSRSSAELPEFEKGGPLQDEPRQLRNDRCVHSLHAGAPGCGAADGVLCKIHDDKADEMVLPQERKKQVYPQRIFPA